MINHSRHQNKMRWLLVVSCVSAAYIRPPVIHHPPVNDSAALACCNTTTKLEPILHVGGLDASEIAVHVLATSLVRDPAKGAENEYDYDYLRERLLAGARTWGRGFPRLAYVFGNNPDIDDLDDIAGRLRNETGSACAPITACRNCSVMEKTATGEMEARDAIERLDCAGGEFSVLRFANCTSKYYGATGPCSRCQESLRWLLRHARPPESGGGPHADRASARRA